MPEAIHHGCIDEFKEKFFRLCTDNFYLSTEYRELFEDGASKKLRNAVESAFKESFEIFADDLENKISKHLFKIQLSMFE